MMSNRFKRVYLPTILLFVIFFVVIFRACQNQHDTKLLENSIITNAIIIEIRTGEAVKSIPTVTYSYNVKGKIYKYEENRNINDLRIGDTLLIEYAVEDHSVARVIDKYYMQKYKYLKK